MAHEVFISYSHRDKPVADAICATLEKDGCRCWYAPRDILPGADWAASIMEAIEHAKALVVVYTDDAIGSPQVLREINNAVRCGAVIIPFRLTKTEPSAGMLYYLSGTHWLDAVNGELQENLQRLSDLTRAVIPESFAKRSTETPPDSKRRFWLMTGIRLAAKFAVAFLMLLILDSDDYAAENLMLLLMLACSLIDLFTGLPLNGRRTRPLRIIMSCLGILFAVGVFCIFAYNDSDSAFLSFMGGGFMILWRLTLLICTCEEQSRHPQRWPVWVDSIFLVGSIFIAISLLPG